MALEKNYEVIVKDGKIKTNYEEVKAQLKKKMAEYEIIQYSDNFAEQLKQLKSDRADLNKMKGAVKDAFVSAKTDFLKPLDAAKIQADELIELIDEPCAVIDKKVKELENTAREKKRESIKEYWDGISIRAGEYADTLYKMLYDPKWENASATLKSYKEGLKNGLEKYLNGMTALSLMTSDFKEDAEREFKLSLDLDAAIAVVKKKEAEREELLKKERERAERIRQEEEARIRREERERAERIRIAEETRIREEERRQAEIREAEAQKKAEAEAKAREKQIREEAERNARANTEAQMAAMGNCENPVQMTMGELFAHVQTTAKPAAAITKAATEIPVVPGGDDRITVSFSRADWRIIQKYAERMGIRYAEQAATNASYIAG